MNGKRIYGVVGIVAVAALAVGGAGGYVFGVQRGRADGEHQLEVKEQVHRERNAEAEAEINRLKNFVAQPQAANANVKPVAADPELDRGYDNDKLVEFFDQPKKYEGKELTVLLRYRANPKPSGSNLRDHLSWLRSQSSGGVSADFYGFSSTGASIKINLGFPKDIDLPAAVDGDPLEITLKCIVLRAKDFNYPTGVGLKVVRPR